MSEREAAASFDMKKRRTFVATTTQLNAMSEVKTADLTPHVFYRLQPMHGHVVTVQYLGAMKRGEIAVTHVFTGVMASDMGPMLNETPDGSGTLVDASGRKVTVRAYP